MKNPQSQAIKAFEKLEKQFKGLSESHWEFWGYLLDLIDDKIYSNDIGLTEEEDNG